MLSNYDLSAEAAAKVKFFYSWIQNHHDY